MCRGDAGSKAAKSSGRARGCPVFRIFWLRVRPIALGRHETADTALIAARSSRKWSDITDASRPALRAEQTVTIVPAGALNANPRPAMTQTSNRFFDEMARLMNDAAGVASGVRREFDTMFRNQADRILRDLDVVKREEFEAVKEMARLAR